MAMSAQCRYQTSQEKCLDTKTVLDMYFLIELSPDPLIANLFWTCADIQTADILETLFPHFEQHRTPKVAVA